MDEIAQLAVFGGVIRQAGAWFRYENADGEIVTRDGRDLKFQGRNAFVEYMRENPAFMDELEARLRGVPIEAPDAEPEPEEGYTIEVGADENE